MKSTLGLADVSAPRHQAGHTQIVMIAARKPIGNTENSSRSWVHRFLVMDDLMLTVEEGRFWAGYHLLSLTTESKPMRISVQCLRNVPFQVGRSVD